MEEKIGAVNKKEKPKQKKDYKNTAKYKDFQIVFEKAKRGYNSTYSNKGFSFKTKDGFPYVFKTIKRKVYGSGLIGFISRIIGAYETELVEGYVCEDHNGNLIDFISKDFGEINYYVHENKLSVYPNITIKTQETYGSKMKIAEYYFEDNEEYDFFFNLIYTELK